MLWTLAFLLVAVSGAAQALDSVTLQLKWRHQFQFAGYYAALEQGYYREAGLDVKLVEATPATNVVEEVAAGRAQFGIGTSELLLARRHAPVVALAVIFQHSPLILLAREDKIGNLHQLAGRNVMIEAHSEELIAYLRNEGLPPEKLHILPHSQSIGDLIEGKVAAISAYSTTEPYLLRRTGLRTIEFSPRASGIDFYGDNLFTSQQELKRHPERVRAFRAASLRGWEYAMKHPDEIIALILARYNSQGLDRGFLAFEASRTAQLMQAQLIEIGHMNPGRWQHIADTYAELDMQAKGTLPADFLYNTTPEKLPGWFIPIAAAAALTILALTLLTLRTIHLGRQLKLENTAQEEVNRQLALQLEEIQDLQARLQEQAIRDALTGLFNRRYLDETLLRELSRAKRDGYPLAVIMVDIDHFKQINDTYGHSAGDEVIRSLGAILRQSARESDITCRYGGEEFVIALPHMGIEAAHARAEKLRLDAAAKPVRHGDFEIGYTLSAGVSAYPVHATNHETLIEYADLALYQSKADGRNRVTCFEPAIESKMD